MLCELRLRGNIESIVAEFSKARKMVKVAENSIVDLDVFPGTHEEKLKAQADALA